jgi:hypothetical protein
MKKHPFYLGVLVAALSFCFMSSAISADKLEIANSGFSLCLATDRAVYSPGDAIEMTLKVSNRTEKTVTFQFRDARRFDFVIETGGKDLWWWSDGRVFAQVLGEERLAPGQTLTYRAKFEGGLKPGIYMVRGMILHEEMYLQASTVIFVK